MKEILTSNASGAAGLARAVKKTLSSAIFITFKATISGAGLGFW
jgi:hypothetical protein